MGKPSLGSWVGYGLGTENQDLPAFVVLPDPGGGIKGGPPAYGAGFLPASYQGTVDARRATSPILDLQPARRHDRRRPAADARPDRPAQRPPPRRRAATTPSSRRGSRPTSWPTGCRVGRARGRRPGERDRRRPKRSTASTSRTTAEFGTRCLLARRLVERGVRFVQLYSGDVDRLGRPRRRRGEPRRDVRPDRQAGRRPA